MDKSGKEPGRADEADRNKKAGRKEPAQEIEDDEVEIAETGGKPEDD
jgi:hypothetical protein